MKFLLLLLIISFQCFAQDTRWIDIEWEGVEGAANYEVELFEDQKGNLTPRGKFKVDESSWSNAVPPGKYSLRIRSLDKRGVPGEWSDYIPVKVHMHNPRPLHPGPGAKQSSSEVDFEWTEVEGASQYQLVIKNSKDKIVYNSAGNEVRASVYLEDLGDYSWSVYALEEGEALRSQDEFTSSSFKSFTRVGGDLDPVEIKVQIAEKIVFSWQKVRSAQAYLLDYLPPADSDKSRRFKLTGTSFAIPAKRLREGVTTVTVTATAPGYPDSQKSIVQVLRSGNKIELQDIIQARSDDDKGFSPSTKTWKDEIFANMILAKYAYSSTHVENDTVLDQKELTAIGLGVEWNHKPKLNSLQRKTELSYLQLSSGREVGTKLRAAFSLTKEKSLSRGRLSYGAGINALKLPAYMGNRFEDDIFVEHSTTLGPLLHISYLHHSSARWAWQVGAVYSQQLVFIESDKDDGKSFGWLNLNTRLLYFISKSEALYLGMEHERWEQKWNSDESSLNGYNLSLGLKSGF